MYNAVNRVSFFARNFRGSLRTPQWQPLRSNQVVSTKPLFDLIQKQAQPILQEIITCPFVELIHLGVLPEDVFNFYSEQDELYMIDYIDALQTIANNLSRHAKTRNSSDFIDGYVRLSHKKIAEGFFNPQRKSQSLQPKPITTAKIDVVERYTQHLKQALASESITVALSAVIPCNLAYRFIASQRNRLRELHSTHPHQGWIEANDNQAFARLGQYLIEAAEVTAQLELADGTLASLNPAITTSIQSYQYERDLFLESFKGRPRLEASSSLRRRTP